MKDNFREAELSKMRRIATGLLLLMTLIYWTAKLFEKKYLWIGFVRAFAEAAVVGALADWFAVTALFRHPLGVPLPHTAVIPKNKNRIGESLGNFVQRNFLTPEAVEEKLQAIDLTGIMSDWLAQPINSTLVADEFCSLTPELLKAVDDEDIQHFIKKYATSALRAIDLNTAFASLLTILTSKNKHQVLFEHVLALIHQAFEDYKPALKEKIQEESPWWFVLVEGDAALYNKIIANVRELLHSIMNDPAHEFRRKFNEATLSFIEKLKTSDDYKAKTNTIKEEILQNPTVQQYFENVWTDIKILIINDISRPDSHIRLRLAEAFTAIGSGLLQDEAVRRKMNIYIQTVILEVVSRHRNQIATLISEKVKTWDAHTITQKLELEVGKDLQYIRINGTLVGGLVGLFMHLVSLLLSG